MPRDKRVESSARGYGRGGRECVSMQTESIAHTGNSRNEVTVTIPLQLHITLTVDGSLVAVNAEGGNTVALGVQYDKPP